MAFSPCKSHLKQLTTGLCKIDEPMKTPSLGLPLIALTMGVLGYFAFSGFRPVTKPVLPSEIPKPNISFADLGRNTARSDQALLKDSAPLFLSTKWNASFSPKAALNDNIVAVSIFPPEVRALNSAFFIEGPKLPFATTPPRKVADGLDTRLSTFGRGGNRPITTGNPMQKKGGILVISPMGITGTEHAFPLSDEVLRVSKTEIWSPVEFFCTVENLTAIGSPAQTKSSGINELDEALSRFAQQKISNNGLPTGYYRITAYP